MRLPSSFILSSLLFAGALMPLHVNAQTVVTSEYIYIGFEAEDHITKDDRWVTTTPSTPTEENDPDGNHSDQAGGSTYLELLPDIRVTHEDEFGPPTAFWGSGGQGPGAEYLVDFPEPGRYYVHARVYSTGTEDNGMHIGINGSWPDSGQRMQFCTASKRAWTWGSAQRDAGGNGSCGTEKTIWIDVPSAGVHTFNISAREDGFELDRLALIKDLSGNTRVCSPTTLTGVNCKNGSIESADGFVDMRVLLSAETVGADPEVDQPIPTEVVQGEAINLTAVVENLDGFDTAHDIVLTLSPAPGDWNMVDIDSRCSAVGDEFECTLSQLHPTAPNENVSFVFTMQALVDGDRQINASILSSDMDDTPANDVTITTIRVLDGVAPVDTDTDLQLSMDTDYNEYETGDPVALAVTINNLGDNDATDVAFNLNIPSDLTLNALSLPNECTFDVQVECLFASIPASGNESFAVSMRADADGVQTLNATISSASDVNSTNNQDSDSFVVMEPVLEMNTDVSAADGGSAGEVTAGSTSGNTDGVDTSAGNTDAATSAGDTDGQSTAGSDGTSAGDAGESDTAGQTDAATPVTSDSSSNSGALVHWFVLAMMLILLTRLYGRHQRQLIAIK